MNGKKSSGNETQFSKSRFAILAYLHKLRNWIKLLFLPNVAKRLPESELMKLRFKMSKKSERDFHILESQFLSYQKKYPFASHFRIIFKEDSQDYRLGVIWNVDKIIPQDK